MRSRIGVRMGSRFGRVVLAVVGIVGLLVASTTGGASASSGRKSSPVGVYSEFSSNGGSATTDINTDGTTTSSVGDSGYWVSMTKAFAFVITSSPPQEGDVECVLLGAVNKHGINSEAKPGPQNCVNEHITWYAIKTGSNASVLSSRVPRGDAFAVTVVGTYTAHYGDDEETLTLNSDETYTSVGSSSSSSGYWVAQGKSFAMTDATSPTSGCLYLGKISKHGINSARKQGPRSCQNSPGTWYATRSL
jgi:hypothetical protein